MNEEKKMKAEDAVERCKDCKFYICADSGYGYCRRYPPKDIRAGREVSYQRIEECRIACGEFIRSEPK